MTTNPQRLEEMHEDQSAEVVARATSCLARGSAQNAKDFYPEISLSGHVAYARSPVSLPMLSLMYDCTVVFVPPVSRSELEKRWNISLEDFVTLCEQGIIQPLLGRTQDYVESHFDHLISLSPPALWSRGLALLTALNMGDALNENHCPLPIGQMAQVRRLRRKYETRFPHLTAENLTERIKRELITNYADLIIFGEDKVADGLGVQATPAQAVDRLLLANEVRTYPVLFGFEGTANYDADFVRVEGNAHRTIQLEGTDWNTQAIPVERLQALLSNIGLETSQMPVADLAGFHASSEGAALRRAMRFFEREADAVVQGNKEPGEVAELTDRAEALEGVLKSNLRTLNSTKFRTHARQISKQSRIAVQIGVPAIGGWLSHLIGRTPLEGLTGGALLQQVITKSVSDRIVDADMRMRFSPGLANLWTVAASRMGATKASADDQ